MNKENNGAKRASGSFSDSITITLLHEKGNTNLIIHKNYKKKSLMYQIKNCVFNLMKTVLNILSN